MPRRSRLAGFPEDVKDLVLARGRGKCDRCGSSALADFHHRQPRGMGGARGARSELVNGAANCVALCRPCHEWVEAHRGEALADGWLVSRYEDPCLVPVVWNFGWRRGLALLDNNGGVTNVTPK